MKKQVLIIHGGTVFKKYQDYLAYLKNYKFESLKDFKTKYWKENLEKDLGRGYEVIRPKMPCKRNAKYIEWEIWLNNYLPLLKENIVLVGHSLGATFLIKYLLKNKFPKKISQLHLISAAIKGTDEDLASFLPPKNLKPLEKICPKIFLWHSKNDPIVPFSDFKILSRQLVRAEKIIYKKRGHFNQKHFKALVKKIKNN